MQYAIKDACNVFLHRKSDNMPALYSDYANSTTLSFTSDRVFAKAKGVNKIHFDTNREGTFTIEMEVFDLAWISVLLGGIYSKETKDFAKREVLTVSATNTVTIAGTPKAGSLAIFTLERDLRTHDTQQTAGASTNPNEYSIAGNVVTLNAASCPEGTKVVVYYLEATATAVKTYKIKANEFPINYVIYGDSEIKNEFGDLEQVQFKICNCSPRSAMEITLSSTDITTVTAEFDLLADENGDMAEMTIIE